MPEVPIRVLLDQNIPAEVADWLRKQRPSWRVQHVRDLGFQGKTDAFLYQWTQQEGFLIVTYDEDFGDARMHPLGKHHGIVRLRVWPTTVEETVRAISRVLSSLSDTDLKGSLVIVDNRKIRVRKP